jgi:hypothetical protein
MCEHKMLSVEFNLVLDLLDVTHFFRYTQTQLRNSVIVHIWF